MKIIATLSSMLVLGLLLAGLAAAAERATDSSSSTPTTTPTMDKMMKGTTGAAMGGGGGLPSGPSGSYAAKGCCQPPSPDPSRLCCDSRDCGWFDCSVMGNMVPKTYKPNR